MVEGEEDAGRRYLLEERTENLILHLFSFGDDGIMPAPILRHLLKEEPFINILSIRADRTEKDPPPSALSS